MSAIPSEGRLCDQPAVRRVTLQCSRVPEHLVTSKVCELHRDSIATSCYCRQCYDQLHDGIRLNLIREETIVTNIPGQRPSGLIIP